MDRLVPWGKAGDSFLLITNTNCPIGTKIDLINLISIGFTALCRLLYIYVFMYGNIHNSDNNKICILLL